MLGYSIVLTIMFLVVEIEWSGSEMWWRDPFHHYPAVCQGEFPLSFKVNIVHLVEKQTERHSNEMQVSHFRPLDCHTWKGPMIKEKVDQRERERELTHSFT